MRLDLSVFLGPTDFCEEPEVFTEPMGEITSPMYPSQYESNYNCQNDITVSEDAKILLQFHDVDLDEGDMIMVSGPMDEPMVKTAIFLMEFAYIVLSGIGRTHSFY